MEKAPDISIVQQRSFEEIKKSAVEAIFLPNPPSDIKIIFFIFSGISILTSLCYIKLKN